MNILYFHQHFSTPRGSAGTRSYERAKRLVARGHSVTMVCGSYGGGNTGLTQDFRKGCRRGNVDGIDVVEFDLPYSNETGFLRRGIMFLKYAFHCVSMVFREKADLVFATTTPLTAGIPGIFAKWFARKPFVFEVRDLWPELPKAMGVISNPLVLWALGALEWASYRSADRLIALSPGMQDGIARRGVARERVAMIPNGCDLQIFGHNADAWRPADIAADDLLAVFAGTHGIANGLDAVLDAAAVLMERGRDDIKVLLIGQGKLKPSLVERAKRQQLENVVFHDPVDKLRLAGLMQASDIGLQVLADVPAFYHGTSPNKFFDYIAAGLPVLNNYPGWLAEMIVENACGIAVPPRDPKAFADALERAAADRQALRKWGENARKLAESRFARDRLAEQFADWLEEAAPRA